MLLISETYETWDEDAIEAGETDDSGFNFQAEEYSFRDLVQYIRREGFSRQGETRWLETEDSTNYRTGEATRKALHFDRENSPHKWRYWLLAIKAAQV
jgi:hypothetical protein